MQGIAGAVFSSFNGGVENEFTSRTVLESQATSLRLVLHIHHAYALLPSGPRSRRAIS